MLKANDLVSGGSPSLPGKALVKGVNVIAGFRDQPVDGKATPQKHSKNTRNDELNHFFVVGTMN